MNEMKMIARAMKEKVLDIVPLAEKFYHDDSCFAVVISEKEEDIKLRVENFEYDGVDGELTFIIFPDSSLAEFDIESTLYNETMVELGFQLAVLILEEKQ